MNKVMEADLSPYRWAPLDDDLTYFVVDGGRRVSVTMQAERQPSGPSASSSPTIIKWSPDQ